MMGTLKIPRRWLPPSPAAPHELSQLELPGAWEPPASLRAVCFGESKRSQLGFFDGNKEEEIVPGKASVQAEIREYVHRSTATFEWWFSFALDG